MPIKKTKTDPISEEKLSEAFAEVEAHEKSEVTAEEIAVAPDEEAQKAAETEAMTDTDVVVPAEVAAIHEEEEPTSKLERRKAKKVERAEEKAEKAAAKKEVEAKSRHSKKFLAAKAKVEPGKLYQLADALTLIKELSVSKFDGSVEIHLRLNKKKAKGSTESSRGVVHMPHGTGKEKKVVVLDEKMIDEIAKTKRMDFDICIASPELMPKVAKIAKILGPKGKMPDPKSGTVTNDPKKVMEEIKSGKTEYRVDASGIVHQIIGKVSWEDTKLAENAKVVMAIYPKSRLNSAFVTASIAPSIPLDLSKF